MTLILLGIYISVLIVVFAFIAIVVMHIGSFREYSRHLSVVLKLYLIAVLVIGAFGGYKIVTSKNTVIKKSNPAVNQKLEF